MTLIEEMIAAGRGLIALLVGRRDAAAYFDLTLRGLVGSLVAFIFVGLVNAATLKLLFTQAIEGPEGGQVATIAMWQALLAFIVIYALQVGFAAIVLNWMKRLDGFVPYVIASNWLTFFTTFIQVGLLLIGLGGLMQLMTYIVFIVILVNIARILVTLTPMQIVVFLLVQIVGVSVVVFFLLGFLSAGPAPA